MAVRVERKVVCDFGDRHSGDIRTYRVTADGTSTTLDLCPTCAKPITKLLAKGDRREATSPRMKVYTLSEIEQKKTPTST